jgi:hypothetical protein
MTYTKKAFELNYTKANGKTENYLILTPDEFFFSGNGGFVATVCRDGYENVIRRFNWHRINSFAPLHKRPILANGLSAVTI